METILNIGITWNIFFQNLGSWLKTPMEAFSFFGSEYFFLILLPALYWCLEASIGLRVGIILLLSTSVNDALKMALHGPRPYWISTDVIGYASETSFGVPSGHAQIAVGVWGMLAARSAQVVGMADRNPDYSADRHLAHVPGGPLSTRCNFRMVDRSHHALACSTFLETGG